MPGLIRRRSWSTRSPDLALRLTLGLSFAIACGSGDDDATATRDTPDASGVDAGDSDSGSEAVVPTVPPAELEPGELRPGGDTTSDEIDVTAFMQPAANLGLARRTDFETGRQFFLLDWEVAPGRADTDGLGPTFLAARCVTCHDRNGRGQPARSPEDKNSVGVLIRFGAGAEGAPLAAYGTQLQPFGVDGVPGEGWARRTEVPLVHVGDDGREHALSMARYDLMDLAFGEPEADLHLSPRLTPHLVGQGLLEAIDEADLIALEDPDDRDGDGISGRVALLDEAIGRFGWKATQASVLSQSSAAFAEDLGITSELHPDANCPAPQTACAAAPSGGSPELPALRMRVTASYLRLLAVPARREGDHPEVLRGKALFRAAGCASCHHPRFVTGAEVLEAELARQTIWPYTDLLLHDMGDGLADGLREGDADGREWRTPPLWGLGLLETVNDRRALLHDGRARNVDEAILWHGGEATAARTAYERLPETEAKALVRFVESL